MPHQKNLFPIRFYMLPARTQVPGVPLTGIRGFDRGRPLTRRCRSFSLDTSHSTFPLGVTINKRDQGYYCHFIFNLGVSATFHWLLNYMVAHILPVSVWVIVIYDLWMVCEMSTTKYSTFNMIEFHALIVYV